MIYHKLIRKNAYLIGIFILSVVIIIISTFFKINQHKEEIEFQKQCVYQMLGAYENGIEGKQIAASILKGNINKDLIEKGSSILRGYGYDEDYETIYDLAVKTYKSKIIIFNMVIYLSFIGLVFSIIFFMKKQEKQKLEELDDVLTKFHNGEYVVNLPVTLEGIEGKINSQLESLGKRLLLNESRLKLEKEETKGLVTDISHQLKTPIASLKMCLSLLNEENLEPLERKEFMERSIEQIDHLEALTAALINISRMETGMIKIHRENKRIVDTILSAINSVYIKADEKNILINFDSNLESEVENLALPHDEKWTREAISNVLENAIKYSEKGTTITIKITKLINFLRIEIEDEGIGIDKKEYTKIFKRFYRGKSEEVKNAEGSGVGLYLTRKILEEQGGNITVTSKKSSGGKGSRFVIQLSLM